MTYHLDPRNPLVEEVRLVARNQIDRALKSAADAEGDRVDAVHDLRKRMKKLRALLRLVRPGLGETYAAENRAFRYIARPLSPIRDAQVLSETVAKLREGSRASANLRPLADWADARQTRAIEGVDLPQMLETARQEIAAARARVAGWTLDGESRKVLGKGLGKTYGRARKLHRTAADSRDARDLHEWRQRVK